MTCYKIRLNIRTESEANVREHWATKARRVKYQRSSVAFEMLSRRISGATVAFPATVTLTRIAPRMLDDDNLARSFKAIRDEVANCLGLDDRDPRISWRYGQRRGLPKEYAVEIAIEPRASAAVTV